MTLLHHDTTALILSHWELSINQLSNQMSTGPCDVKLSQDQRRFIKKKSSRRRAYQSWCTSQRVRAKINSLFFITVTEKIILGVRNT